jgi:GTPase involved in cell partitioning and DNA repair
MMAKQFFKGGYMKNVLNELDELIKEAVDLDKEINTIEEKKQKIEEIKKEINIKEEQLKKSAFVAILNKYDKVLELYPEHHIESSTLKYEIEMLDDALNYEVCNDLSPINVTTCKRCSLIYLRKYIEKEIANFYIM